MKKLPASDDSSKKTKRQEDKKDKTRETTIKAPSKLTRENRSFSDNKNTRLKPIRLFKNKGKPPNIFFVLAHKNMFGDWTPKNMFWGAHFVWGLYKKTCFSDFWERKKNLKIEKNFHTFF